MKHKFTCNSFPIILRRRKRALVAQKQSKELLRRLFAPRILENRTPAVFLMTVLYTLENFELSC